MKKLSKFILGLAMVLSVGAVSTACGGNDEPPLTAEERVAVAYEELVYDGLDSCRANINLITEIDGVNISYTVATEEGTPSEFIAISADGKVAEVTRPILGSTDKGYELAILTATLSYEEVSRNKIFAVKVLEGGVDMSVSEYLALTSADKTVASVDAVVVSVGSGCAMVADETGVVLVYSTDATKNLKVGDYVLVEGSIGFYNGVPQFSYSSEVPVRVTVLDGTPSFTYTTPTPEVWGDAEVDAYLEKTAVEDLLGHYVTVQGILECHDKYFNVVMSGVTKGVGASICYPNDTMKAQLVELDGKMIKITGYTLYVSHEAMYVFTDVVEEVTISAEEQLEAAKNSLSVEAEIYDDFVLPATGTYGATITWTSNNDAIVVGEKTDAGYPATVTTSSADVEVKLTATIKLGDLEATKEITVTVKAVINYDHAGTLEDPYSPSDANKKANTLAADATTEDYFYIKGIIVDDSKYSVDTGDHGNATFNIVETADSTEKFLIFRAYDKDGNKFTSSTVNFAKGDTVVVCAKITNYKGNTPETAQGGKIVSVVKGEGTETPEPEVPGDAITSIADALAAADGASVNLSGTVSSIDTYWNYAYNNISVNLSDGENEILIYRAKELLYVGDEITVTGTLGSYKGTKQITDPVVKVTNAATVPATATTVVDALAAADGSPVEFEGTVSEIKSAWSTQYKNMDVYVSDDAGNKILVYRLGTEVKLNDKVSIKGFVYSYNSEKQVAQGAACTIKTEEGGVVDPEPENPGDTPAAGTVAAALALDFASAANKASADDYMKTNYPNWKITGKLVRYV